MYTNWALDVGRTPQRTLHPALPVSRLGKLNLPSPQFTRPVCRTYLLRRWSAKICGGGGVKVRDVARALAKPQRPRCGEKPETARIELFRVVSPRNH